MNPLELSQNLKRSLEPVRCGIHGKPGRQS